MKSVLMSIKPKYCELIANGIKTVEVRKTKPKLELPFKVYIYCTSNKDGTKDLLEIHDSLGKIHKANSKVIGEFVCKGIMRPNDNLNLMSRLSCVSKDELYEYSNGKQLYGWRITDLVIYDKPKELWNFKKECIGYVRNDEDWCLETCPEYELGGCDGRYKPIYTPPMSWCYVEDLGV
jgi:predicted transcriptional regulator